MDMQRRLLVQICFLYYEKNMTQQEIARETGLSRIKVSRLLQKAKELGIVKISVDYSGSFLETEEQIKSKYQLQKVIIIDSAVDTNTQNMVAAAAAYYLENNIVSDSTIAVGWGTTLRLIQDHMHMMNRKALFCPIIGGHGKHELDIHASSIASNLAKKTGCASLSLLAPAFVQTGEEKEIILRDSLVKEVLSRSASADYALFSLGNPLKPGSSITKSGYFSPADIELLHQENAVCDMVSILFMNEKCQPCCESLTQRSIGIAAQELKKIPTKICVVNGRAKHLTTKVALEAKFVDVLILDDIMAEYLLNS